MTYVPPPIIDPQDVPAFARRDVSFDSKRYLSHYTTWDRLLDIAHSRSLRLSSVTRMNDPRESKHWFFSNSGGPDLPMDIGKQLSPAELEFRSHVNVVAFATDRSSKNPVRFDAGFARPRMWAQYAANHTGVCLVLERAELVKRFEKMFAAVPGAHLTSANVRYKRVDPLNPAVSIPGARTPAEVEATVRQFYLDHWKDAFYVKHEDWRDEREFRLAVFQPGHTGPFYIDLVGAVAGLVLGSDFEDAHLSAARVFNDELAVGGRVVRIQWNRLGHRLLPVADDGGKWVVSRSREAVAGALRWRRPSIAP